MTRTTIRVYRVIKHYGRHISDTTLKPGTERTFRSVVHTFRGSTVSTITQRNRLTGYPDLDNIVHTNHHLFFSIHYGVASETPRQTAGRSARELGYGVYGILDRIYDDGVFPTDVPIIQSVRRTIFVLLPIVDVGNVRVTIFVSDL